MYICLHFHCLNCIAHLVSVCQKNIIVVMLRIRKNSQNEGKMCSCTHCGHVGQVGLISEAQEVWTKHSESTDEFNKYELSTFLSSQQ